MVVPTIDYSSRDFEAIKTDLIRAIPFFLPEWTQHNENDFGIALINLFSMTADTLHYYIDRVHNESFLATLIKRESAINQLSLIDYKMSGPSAAIAEIVFSLNSVQSQDTKVAAGTALTTSIISASDVAVRFETLEDLIIRAGMVGDEVVSGIVQDYNDLPSEDPPGLPVAESSLALNTVYYVVAEDKYYRVNNSGNWVFVDTPVHSPVTLWDNIYFVAAEQGESKSNTFPTPLQGIAFEKFIIPDTEVIDGSVIPYVNEGGGFTAWTVVENWLGSTATDRHVVIYTDANGKVTMEFGNDIQGKKLIPSWEVKASYRVGGGLVGNVGADTILTIITPESIYWVSDYNTKVPATSSNPEQASGGNDEESVDEARSNGPQSLRALYRAVTVEDFKTLTEQVPGVARAAVVEGGSLESCGFCGVIIAVYPEGGGPLTEELKNRILAALNDKRMICTSIDVERADDVPVNIKGTAYGYVNYEKASVEDNLTAAIDDFFDTSDPNVDFQQPIYLSDLTAALDGTNGIDHVDFVEVTEKQIPVYGPYSGDWKGDSFEVGSTSTYESWEAEFIDPENFKVKGSVSGDNINGKIGVPYTSDNGQISFTVASGEVAPEQGDKMMFKTSPKIGNVIPSAGGVPTVGDVEMEVVIPEDGGRESGPCK